MTDVKLQKLEAEVFGTLLNLALLEPKDIVGWADFIVAAEPDPDPAVLAISVNAREDRFDRHDALHALSRVGGACRANEVTNALLGLVSRWIKEDRSPGLASRIATIIYELANGISEVRTPAGLHLELDSEDSDFYTNIDRLLSELDPAEWNGVLDNFLRPYARNADQLRHPPRRVSPE